MCYDIKTSLQSQLNYAKRYTPEIVDEIMGKLIPFQEKIELDLAHISGFSHPPLLIYTENKQFNPSVAQWGLIPEWSKDEESAKRNWNTTINARSETIFEKPTFRDAVMDKRCLLVVDGFYEYHYKNGKSYPYYFYRTDQQPIILAGIWTDWTNPQTRKEWKTFTVLTTLGNDFFHKIHNNPKLKEPRMPVILTGDEVNTWLNKKSTQSNLSNLFHTKNHPKINAHTVKALRGKLRVKNIEETHINHHYPDLEQDEVLRFNF